MAGQVSHFVNYAPHIEQDADHTYALNRYQNEYRRLLQVMDTVLSKQSFLAAGGYSLADMASFVWVLPYKAFGADLNDYPNLLRWYNLLKERPGLKRGVDTLKPKKSISKTAIKKENLDNLFKGSKL